MLIVNVRIKKSLTWRNCYLWQLMHLLNGSNKQTCSKFALEIDDLDPTFFKFATTWDIARLIIQRRVYVFLMFRYSRSAEHVEIMLTLILDKVYVQQAILYFKCISCDNSFRVCFAGFTWWRIHIGSSKFNIPTSFHSEGQHLQSRNVKHFIASDRSLISCL